MSAAGPLNALPPPSADAAITGTASTAGQETPAIADASQARDDGGTSGSENIPSYTPDKRKSEVLRILRWPDWAYYEILDVQETATKSEIESAYRKKSLQTHTDQNSDSNAKEVFLRLTTAKDTLVDETKRREYNTQRADRKSRGELVENDLGEEYAENAYGGRDGDDADGDGADGDDGDDDEPKLKSEAKVQLLNSMSPVVKGVLDSSDGTAYKKLKQLDEKMRELNESEGNHYADHALPLIPIKKTGEKRRTQLEILRGSTQDTETMKKAKDELERLQVAFKELLQDLDLPVSWVFDVPATNTSSAGRQPSAGGRQARNPPAANPPAAGGNSTDESSDAMDTTCDWKPGETIRGEKILAFRPITITGTVASTGEIGQIYSSIKFVIRREGEHINPIEIVDEARVGSAAVAAYLALPKEEKCNITRVDRLYDRSDASKFGPITGVARDPNAAKNGTLPWTVVMASYDGESRVVNRTTLRKAIKEQLADTEINRFLISVGEEPDPPKQARLAMKADTRRLLDYRSDGLFGDSSTRFLRDSLRTPRDQEEHYDDCDPRNPPHAGPVTMPADSQRSRNQGGDRAPDTPGQPPRQTDPRRPGPPAPRRTAPVQPPFRTSTTNTPPDVTRNEQRQTGAAEDKHTALEMQVSVLATLVQQLVVSLSRTQEPGAARS